MNIVDWNGTEIDLDYPYKFIPEPEPLSEEPVERQLQLLHRANLANAQEALDQQFANGHFWTGGIPYRVRAEG
jgi:hypothetical protein